MTKKKKAATRLQRSFPEQVYLVYENADTRDEFLSASESFDDAADGADVAIYTLLKVRRKRVTHDLKD